MRRRTARLALGSIVAIEGLAAVSRHAERSAYFVQAARRAQATKRKLVVVGDPNGGSHTRLLPAYGCGDVCVDLQACPACPGGGTAVDLTKQQVPGVADNSAVVYVSCVFEYVTDPQAMWREIMRMAGSPENVWVVPVQWWTLTAAGVTYPGAKWTVRSAPPPAGAPFEVKPVTDLRKVATWAALGWLAYSALFGR